MQNIYITKSNDNYSDEGSDFIRNKYFHNDNSIKSLFKVMRKKFKVLLWFYSIRLYHLLKRTIDIVGSVVAFILFAPVFLITSLFIIIEDGTPVFYSQKRVGVNGHLFNMYKFRSMYRNADKKKSEMESDNITGKVIFKMKHDPRITKVGRIIRKLSIDELPQLLNVLKGDLTLVGPRPPLPNEVMEYSDWDYKRLSVKPGLTCIWQVSGRSDIDFDNQVILDMEYIKQRSIFFDLILLLKTIPAVLTGKGAY